MILLPRKKKYKKLTILHFTFLIAITFLILYQLVIQKTSLIARDGDHLVIKNTNQKFRFLGGNHFNLLVKYLWGEFDGLTGPEVFEISSEHNINVIRFWATCSNSYWSDQCLYSGPNNWNNSKDKFFEKFDELVNDAQKYNIYLIPSLSDGFDSFRTHEDGSEVCVVGSKANIEYKRFVQDVVTRYKDKDIILAWEIGNEGSLHCSKFDDLINWYEDTSKFIRSLDQNHLISTGENNLGTLNTTPFDSVHSDENISLASVHIYDKDLYNLENGNTASNIGHFINYWTSVSHEDLGKPVYFGEFGSYDISTNPNFYDAFMRSAYNSDVDGIIFWSWLEGAECQKPAAEGGMCITPSRTPAITERIDYWALKFKQENELNRNFSIVSTVIFLILPLGISEFLILKSRN